MGRLERSGNRRMVAHVTIITGEPNNLSLGSIPELILWQKGEGGE